MAAQLFVWFSLISLTFAATISTDNSKSCDPITDKDCLPSPDDCQLPCGCDGTLIYDAEKDACVLHVKFLRREFIYPIQDGDDNDGMSLEDAIAKKRSDKVDKVFRGIIISAILFIVCASICVVSVCIFCCHIRYSDRKLKSEVKALTKKLKKTPNKDSTPLVRKKQREPKEESCNVVVAGTDIMCV